MGYTETCLCQLTDGCMGCCGHDFGSKEEIKEAIRKNTLEFVELNPQNDNELIKFMNRAHPMDLRFGVCRNLIEKEGQLLCPLHPEQRKGRDLRRGHCEVNHLCQTAKEFAKWDKDTQKEFLNFLCKKQLDNLDYSMGMDNDGLLKEFKSLQKKETK